MERDGEREREREGDGRQRKRKKVVNNFFLIYSRQLLKLKQIEWRVKESEGTESVKETELMWQQFKKVPDSQF